MSDISLSLGADHALQEAIFAVLVDDAMLTDMLGGLKVFDHVAEGTTFPYIAFSNLTTRDGSTATEPATECRLTLNVWSQELGKRQVLSIMQRIRTLLHDQNIALSEHRLVNLREEFADIAQQRDRNTFRGLIRFRAFIEQ